MTDAEFERWKRMVNRAGLHVGPDKRVPDAPKPPPAAAQVISVVTPAAVVKTGFRTQCKARCLGTGLRCKLLDGHTTAHAHERGAFARLLGEGQEPARPLDAYAGVRTGSPMAEG